MRVGTTLVRVSAFLAVMTAGLACIQGGSPGGGSMTTENTLTICTQLSYSPFEFIDPTGNIVGLDIDLMKLVAAELHAEVSVRDTPFGWIRSGEALRSRRCRVAAAAITITPERRNVLDFSDPYFEATQAMLVRAGRPYQTLNDLTGLRVGALADTTGRDYLRRFERETGYTVVEYQNLAAEQQALTIGQIDAAVNDLPVWTEYIKENPGEFEVAAEFDTGEKYGFAVRKSGDRALLATINTVLARARKDGTYDTLYRKWIGRKPTI